MSAVYKKELRAYFSNMTGYVVIAFMLLITGIFSVAQNFKGGYPQFEYNLSSVAFVLLFVVPILTMRSLAEEKHQRTDQLLYSLPMSMTEIILGKYFAMLTVFAIPVGVMCLYPLIFTIYGTVGFAATYSSIFAFFLLGAALIAIGLFMSSLTESQIIAAVLSFGALLLCNLMSALAAMIPNTAIASFIAFTVVVALFALLIYFMTKNYWVAFIAAVICEIILLVFYMTNQTAFAGLFPQVINWLSLFDRLYNFAYYNLFDITSVIYYVTVSALFVFFTIQSVDKRRWS